ncbi:MAG: kynureninase [Anaerolineales bacterium]|nr:kynureninase [Anaerolineales bacterium]
MNEKITDAAYAAVLDAADSLASFRDRFVIDDPNLIYVDGNSLGRLPVDTAVHMQTLIADQWGQRLIGGWNNGWIELQERIGRKIAPLIGAKPNEVIVADSTSVNLFKLALAAVQAQPGRHKIITDNLNFPSDLYVLQGVGELVERPLRIQIVPSPDGIHGPVDSLAEAIDDDTALVTLSHTTFKSSFTYDMKAMTALAHRAGAMMLWDMSHSVGSVPGELNTAGADLAVGCTYKYVNGGPGSPAFLYIRHDWQDKLKNPIPGWMGQQNMFEFGLDYEPEPGLRHFLTGTPPILSIAAIEPGVDLLSAAGMQDLRAKSVQQTEYLIALWEAWLAPLGFALHSPRQPAQRGSHISLAHPDGWRIAQALINDKKVLPDFRKPNLIRFGIAPIYNSFMDVYTAVSRLRQVVTEHLYDKYDHQLTQVT